ncbi:hypothetical protein JCM6882_004327 [Rhodosporidiobolus microsporus]
MSGEATSPDAVAAQMAAVRLAVDQIMAPVVIGTFLSCLMMGVVAALIAYYYGNFARDRLVFKLLVAFLGVAAVFDTGVACSWTWLYAVKGFMDPQVLSDWPLPLTLYALITGTVVLCNQLFFTWRVWVVSGRASWALTGAKLVLVLFGAGVIYFIFGWTLNRHSLFELVQIKWWLWAWLICGLLVDCLISAAMVWYLWIKPRASFGSGSARSSVLQQLVIRTFQTNLVSLVLQVVTLSIAITQSASLLYAAPGLVESKVYISCVLLTLNSRTAFGGEGVSTNPSSFLPPRSKGLSAGMRGTFSRGGQPAHSVGAVHVQVDEEVAIDGADDERKVHVKLEDDGVHDRKRQDC